MALRAAHAAGASVPAKVWKRLADAIVDYAEPVSGTESGLRARGFRYTTNAEHATGSMTAAGIAVLAICLENMRGRTGAYERALDEGAHWLTLHFDTERTPVPTSESGSMGRMYYYLYGVERVGSREELDDGEGAVKLKLEAAIDLIIGPFGVRKAIAKARPIDGTVPTSPSLFREGAQNLKNLPSYANGAVMA